jgi:hypothetical protein
MSILLWCPHEGRAEGLPALATAPDPEHDGHLPEPESARFTIEDDERRPGQNAHLDVEDAAVLRMG